MYVEKTTLKTWMLKKKSEYRMCAIICSGLYIFLPIFHCGLYSKAANIANDLCTKKEIPQRFHIKSVRYVILYQNHFRAKLGTCLKCVYLKQCDEL